MRVSVIYNLVRVVNGGWKTLRPMLPMLLHYELRKRRERLLKWVAWHLPRELVMWCYVRIATHATTGKYGDTVVPELGMMDALKRWDDEC